MIPIYSKILVCLLIATIGALQVSAQGAPRDIGPIYVTPGLTTYGIVVRSDDEMAKGLLTRAMTAHGGYRVENSMNKASFAFNIRIVSETAAQLIISSGVPEQEQHRETVVGQSKRQAIFKAIDLAIRKTSGQPGFFSGKIAYVGEHQGRPELFAVDFFFGEGYRLTQDRAEIVRPRWSPDGSYIVYTSFKSGYANIHRMDMRQQRYIVMAKFDGTNTSARYSPDGSRIAMVLTGGGNADVYVGSSNPSQLKLRNITKSRGEEAAPCWSKDGAQLIFSSDIGSGVQLYRSTVFGGGMRRIPTDISRYCAEPDWNHANPDLIAFTVRVGDGFQIATYSFKEGRSRFATSESGDAVQAQWLNDGRHILYTRRTANRRRIILFDTMTSHRFQISPDSIGNASQASFLPPR